MPENSGRVSVFKSLDGLRGLAALWVVMDHSCDRYVTTVNLQHWPVYAVSLRGQLGVVIFFLISGYCIVAAAYRSFASEKKVRRFFLDRARRIYPPYLASILVGLIVIKCLAFAQSHHFIPLIHHQQASGAGAKFWLSNLFLVQAEAHQPYFIIVFWSLCLCLKGSRNTGMPGPDCSSSRSPSAC
jgi:peptidoglycan/LPS O-acetylase OafA/YrhL